MGKYGHGIRGVHNWKIIEIPSIGPGLGDKLNTGNVFSLISSLPWIFTFIPWFQRYVPLICTPLLVIKPTKNNLWSKVSWAHQDLFFLFFHRFFWGRGGVGVGGGEAWLIHWCNSMRRLRNDISTPPRTCPPPATPTPTRSATDILNRWQRVMWCSLFICATVNSLVKWVDLLTMLRNYTPWQRPIECWRLPLECSVGTENTERGSSGD